MEDILSAYHPGTMKKPVIKQLGQERIFKNCLSAKPPMSQIKQSAAHRDKY